MLMGERIAVVDDQGRFVYGVGEFANALPGSASARSARPLAVIDPGDREAVRRVLKLFGQQFTAWTPELDSNVTKLQAALREFANPTPPKPEEPTGLGAVVEDRDGIRWVRS